MRFIRVHDILPQKVLVSRESARLLEGLLGSVAVNQDVDASQAPEPLTIDFQGVEGVAPSFLDELITMIESTLRKGADSEQRSLIVAHPPTRLSSKFEAVARGHGLIARALPDGSWLLAAPAASGP